MSTTGSSKVEEEEEFKVELLPEDYAQYDLSFKLIVIGDSGVGKSCLTTKAVKNNFEDYYQATVGFEFLTFSVKIEDKLIKLQIWDTCGQEQYKSLITNFYRNASLAMMVYAINSRESFNNINRWLKEIRIQSHPDVKILLIGNKSDLENERVVSYEEAKKFQEENQILYFCETSAKSGLNTKEVFIEAARILYEEHNNYRLRSRNNSFVDNKLIKEEIPQKLGKKEKKRSKGCC